MIEDFLLVIRDEEFSPYSEEEIQNLEEKLGIQIDFEETDHRVICLNRDRSFSDTYSYVVPTVFYILYSDVMRVDFEPEQEEKVRWLR